MSDIKSPTGQQISGNWKQLVGKVKETWGELTDDDLDKFNGQRDQLEGLIEERTGESRAAIRRKIDKLSESVKDRV
ncbi:MAG: CsbD family protein [Bacteroidetes bacterium]|nr:CsbD family protein [Bacteroidota bacterium]